MGYKLKLIMSLQNLEEDLGLIIIYASEILN